MMRVWVVLVAAFTLTLAIEDLELVPNTRPGTEDYNVVDPLDVEFYGLSSESGETVVDEGDDEPLGDIEDDLEDVIDDLSETIEITVEEVEINNEGQRNRGRFSLSGRVRQARRHVQRFINTRNLTDIMDVPKRKFHGSMRRAHHRSRNIDSTRSDGGRGGCIDLRRTTKASKLMTHTSARMERICRHLSQQNVPRQAVLAKIPEQLRDQFIEMFQKRKQMMSQCCEMHDHDEKKECFNEAYVEKMKTICQMFEQQKANTNGTVLVINKWTRQTQCCHIEDEDEKLDCFTRVSRQIKRGKWNNPQKGNARKRLAHVCTKISRPMNMPQRSHRFAMNEANASRWRQTWEDRRENMKTCCQMSDIEDKLGCAEDLKKEQLNRVCDGEQVRYRAKNNNHRQQRIDQCCEKYGEERYDCFTNRWHGKESRINVTISEIEVVQPDEEDGIVVESLRAGRVVRSVRRERRKNRRQNMDTEERKAKKQKKRAKHECCQVGEEARSAMEEITEEQCGTKAAEYSQNHDGLRTGLCERLFTYCCTNTEEVRQEVKRERKEKRRERRRNSRKVEVVIEMEEDDRVSEAMEEAKDLVVAAVSDIDN